MQCTWNFIVKNNPQIPSTQLEQKTTDVHNFKMWERRGYIRNLEDGIPHKLKHAYQQTCNKQTLTLHKHYSDSCYVSLSMIMVVFSTNSTHYTYVPVKNCIYGGGMSEPQFHPPLGTPTANVSTAWTTQLDITKRPNSKKQNPMR